MPQRLIEGLKRFRREQFPELKEHYERLVNEGQQPTTLFIGCSDSRIDPARLTGALPGELFVVRNVGNFVPSFEADDGFHGTSAAIEFATVVLRVKDIVVCGHSHCGAIDALYRTENTMTPHVNKWLELGRAAMQQGPVDRELIRRTEERSVALQVERLMTFPMISERVQRGELTLHGWHYVIEEGMVYVMDPADGSFRPVVA
jgi:carbonic anhydrase